MESLLNHGADASIPDEEGYTPLMMAAGHNHCQAVALLLDRLHAPAQVCMYACIPTYILDRLS